MNNKQTHITTNNVYNISEFESKYYIKNIKNINQNNFQNIDNILFNKKLLNEDS